MISSPVHMAGSPFQPLIAGDTLKTGDAITQLVRFSNSPIDELSGITRELNIVLILDELVDTSAEIEADMLKVRPQPVRGDVEISAFAPCAWLKFDHAQPPAMVCNPQPRLTFAAESYWLQRHFGRFGKDPVMGSGWRHG
jgi:hypothetical protein